MSDRRTRPAGGSTAKLALVHLGRPEEAEGRAGELRRAGYRVVLLGRMSGTALRHRVAGDRPDVVVIDLSRVPSEGQAAALSLLAFRATRELPTVFVDGAPDKIARVRANVPGAVFATGNGLRRAVEAVRSAGPAAARALPHSVFAPYQGVALAKKLGIKPGATVALVQPPQGVEEHLVPLPEGATLRRGLRGRPDLIMWFVRNGADLGGIDRLIPVLGRDGLWICWPKKTSGVGSDLSHGLVQRAGLDRGLMDYKICSIDQTWSGLRFTRRR